MTARDAALVICGRAQNAAEARELLDMCGLLDGDPLAFPVLGLSKRSCVSCGLPLSRRNNKDICQGCYARAKDGPAPEGEPTGHRAWEQAPLRPASFGPRQAQTASIHRRFPRHAS